MCINLYTLPKRSIAMLFWNVLTTSRQLLVTQLRFRYMFLSASWEHLDSFVTPHDYFWTCSMNFQKFLVLPTVQESSRSVKKCQELVTEVTKKYQDINFGTLLVQIRIVGQGPYSIIAFNYAEPFCHVSKWSFSWGGNFFEPDIAWYNVL